MAKECLTDEQMEYFANRSFISSWLLSAAQHYPAIGEAGLRRSLKRLMAYVKENPGALEDSEAMRKMDERMFKKWAREAK